MLHLTLSSIPLVSFFQRNGFNLTFLPGIILPILLSLDATPLKSICAVDSDFVKGAEGQHGQQSTNSVLMVSPTGFKFNPQTAADNAFMSDVDAIQHPTEADLTTTALSEFHGLHETLTKTAGIHVHLFENDPQEQTPDAVFPNNWFTTHARDSKEKYSLVLYPLKCENRRRERRPDIIDFVKDIAGDKGLLDLRSYEKDHRFLEGTGSLVLDRRRQIVYVSRSERSDVDLAHLWAEKMGYEDVVHFDAFDAKGRPVYHTNVLMSIGTHFAIVCLEAIPDSGQRYRLMDLLSQDRTVIPITLSQMSSFCGNVLEVINAHGLPVLLMSTHAFHAFTSEQIDVLLHHVSKIHHAAIDTIECIGGGSVRCTIAELF